MRKPLECRGHMRRERSFRLRAAAANRDFRAGVHKARELHPTVASQPKQPVTTAPAKESADAEPPEPTTQRL